MIFDNKEFARAYRPALAFCGLAWAIVLGDPSAMSTHAHHMGPVHMTASEALRMNLAVTSPGHLAEGWLLMLAAMMTPLLIVPIYHLRARSFAKRRVRSSLLFVAAYVAVWMLAGVPLSGVSLLVASLSVPAYLTRGLACLSAIVWQFSPMKQICLNRCHAHPSLAAFGLRADLSALRFGAGHALWCVGSCWALMLLPELLPAGHSAAMAVITILVFGERLDPPKEPAWRASLSATAWYFARVYLAPNLRPRLRPANT